MNDVVFECVVTAVAAAVVVYLIWKQQYDQRECSANAIKRTCCGSFAVT